MECPTCRECFDVAIRLEEAARDYYTKMSNIFGDHKSIAAVFTGLAQDEQEHARTLGQVRASNTHTPSIHDRAEQFQKTLDVLVGKVRNAASSQPAHLEEAYLFSDQVEHSEINEIYITLTTESLEPAGEKDFIVSIIDRHLGRIRQLAAGHDATQRRSIHPRDP